jgi:hypothetical protein
MKCFIHECYVWSIELIDGNFNCVNNTWIVFVNFIMENVHIINIHLSTRSFTIMFGTPFKHNIAPKSYTILSSSLSKWYTCIKSPMPKILIKSWKKMWFNSHPSFFFFFFFLGLIFVNLIWWPNQFALFTRTMISDWKVVNNHHSIVLVFELILKYN